MMSSDLKLPNLSLSLSLSLSPHCLFSLSLRRLGVELGKVQVYQEANRGKMMFDKALLITNV